MVGAGIVALLLMIPALLILGTVGGAGKSQNAEAACLPDAQLSVNVSGLKVDHVGPYKKQALTNAALIVAEAEKAKLPRRAAVIALMTAMQESRLLNYANDGSWKFPARTSVMTKAQWNKARAVVVKSLKLPHQAVGHDWDSVGLYQQRPSAGWGTVEQIMNPSYAASTFYKRLKALEGWEGMSYNDAAQTIQRSATPNAYAKHQSDAEAIVTALAGVEVTGDATASDSCEAKTTGVPVSKDGWVQPVKSFQALTGKFGDARGQYPHAGQDFAAPKNTAILAAADGKVTRASCSDLVVGRSPCQVQISHGQENGKEISTLYVHMYSDGVLAKVGQEVKAGDHIAKVGTNGNSSGYHLHFEVWVGKEPTDPLIYLKAHGVNLKR